jgi:hypothetical protein
MIDTIKGLLSGDDNLAQEENHANLYNFSELTSNLRRLELVPRNHFEILAQLN